MEYQNLLDQLKSNHLPGPVGVWPLAYGWWIAAIVLLTLLSVIIFYGIKGWRKNRYRRKALRQAKQFFSLYRRDNNAKAFILSCNCLLKQVVLSAFPRTQVAQLYGSDWTDFLKSHCSPCQYTEKAVYLLGENHYRASPDNRTGSLYPFICHWIKKHHV